MKCIASLPVEPSLWNEPELAAAVAAGAVALLLATIWLMRRKSRDGRGAAVVCLVLSVILHGLLIFYLPSMRYFGGGADGQNDSEIGTNFSPVTIAHFDPLLPTDAADAPSENVESQSIVAPLPLAISDVALKDSPPEDALTTTQTVQSTEDVEDEPSMPTENRLPSSLASTTDAETSSQDIDASIDDLLSQWLSDDSAKVSESIATTTEDLPSSNRGAVRVGDEFAMPVPSPASTLPAVNANVPGLEVNDFGNRAGDAKRQALLATGGDDSTEAAVEAALGFLAADQRSDGSWDPTTSGAGRETLTLGTDRGGAGKRATNGITGLALLSMLGAGNTHLEGPYAENVRRGLTYLIRSQQPDGSLAGPATVYEANYCHGMAALAMCEAAAMTGDESAIRSATAAVRYTVSMQHPTTGGWRYVKGDPGDLSQLGWQAMVMEAGKRASITVPNQSFLGTSRFLRSVRVGQHGGLACYRPGEAPTRTMTAEALATRLLIGEHVPSNEIAEAEAFLLRQPPGVGKDNYYGWYYTSLALHQLQNEAWRQWNDAMKARLISRQLPGGSWPTDDEWGGYGGRVYTTAMAAMCLEVYYRHAIRADAVASRSRSNLTR